MTTQLFKANTRAQLISVGKPIFLFFGNYFNPERVQFGKLRVLNDDTIAAGAGFGTHGHANMEIITIPLEGGLMHKDSMGMKVSFVLASASHECRKRCRTF
jgi:redox-sensitive bicupin YhaK (pirin superfamily)